VQHACPSQEIAQQPVAKRSFKTAARISLAMLRNTMDHACRLQNNVQCATETTEYFKTELEMWANAQCDGRPAEYRWRPLFNAAKFG